MTNNYPGMSSDELIAALRKDMAATSAERDHQAHERAEAEEEVAKLEAAAKAASMPHAEICAALHAIRQKFASLF